MTCHRRRGARRNGRNGRALRRRPARVRPRPNASGACCSPCRRRRRCSGSCRRHLRGWGNRASPVFVRRGVSTLSRLRGGGYATPPAACVGLGRVLGVSAIDLRRRSGFGARGPRPTPTRLPPDGAPASPRRSAAVARVLPCRRRVSCCSILPGCYSGPAARSDRSRRAPGMRESALGQARAASGGGRRVPGFFVTGKVG